MRRHRKTKILATLGPASRSEEMIEALFLAGVDVFRLNFSHGTHDDHRATLEKIRKIEAAQNRPIGIVADLQGPKLRIGQFKDGKIALKKGQSFRFDSDDALGDETRVKLPHPEVIESMSIGDHIYLDDGKVRVEIVGKGDGYLEGTIQSGLALSNNKGFNIPGVVLPIPALTEKDRIDLDAALEMGVDWVAQSFVQKPEDVIEAKDIIKGRAKLMAKIEKPSAVAYIEEIIEEADGIMLARGDLGVEIPPEDVPAVQKEIIRQVRHSGKPVVVATQMLESMIENARPTRAEASDVATAVYDGADCVMLSAETAAGAYPVEAVTIMNKIAERTEKDPLYLESMESRHPESSGTTSDAITTAAYYVALDVDARVIANYTLSGSTALRTARQRPEMPILCLTPEENVARQLCLSYGVYAYKDDATEENLMGTARHAADIARREGFGEVGDRIVITAGVPFGVQGSTNILRVARIREEE